MLGNLTEQVITAIFEVEQVLALRNIERLLAEIVRARRIPKICMNTRLQQRCSRQSWQRFLFSKGIGDMTSFAQAGI